MCILINISRLAVQALGLAALWLLASPLWAQNVALHFDGANDYVTLNPIQGLAPNADFTVEMQFTVGSAGPACGANFRRLFSLYNTSGTASRFEVGECGGDLRIFWQSSGGAVGPIAVPVAPLLGTGWRQISVVRSGNTVQIFLDCTLLWTNTTNPIAGTLNSQAFRIGHWPGGPTLTPPQDWEGLMDEVKVWGAALTPAQLTACEVCVLTGTEPNLLVYWLLDDGIPGGANSLTQVADATPIGNNGVLTPSSLVPPGFGLTGNTSNFVNSTAPLIYPNYLNLSLLLSDPLQTVALGSICSGDAVHFSLITPNGLPAQAGAGTSVQWEYSDNGGFSWTPIAATPSPSAVFSGFSFVSPPAHPATTLLPGLCSPNAFANRIYRAVISVTNALGTCTYTVQSIPLEICCPIQNASLTVLPMPLAPITTFCEGDVLQFNVTLSSNMPQPNAFNNVHISWEVEINGSCIPLTGPGYDDQMVINYGSVTAGPPQICFKATISNCSCPPVTVTKCIKVDPKPVCGTITGWPQLNPTNLTQLSSQPLVYEICPGDDATLGIVQPSGFANCIPNWEYSFGTVTGWTWVPLGASNSLQNTNILPFSPTPPWPATSIFYRISCVPLTPNSGCDPCLSDTIEIRLKAPPIPPVLPANATICYGQSYPLNLGTPPNGEVYELFCNGLSLGTGSFFSLRDNACYRVAASNGCETVLSNEFCLQVCKVIPKISCPLAPNPCATAGIPITLSGMASFSTCDGMLGLSYSWTWMDIATPNNGTFTGPIITHLPDAGGTIYTLTVTDTHGCVGVTQTTIIPCQ